MASDVTIRPVGEDDFDGWAKLFRRYRDFYNLDPDEAVVKTVWGWLMDPAHEVNSLVAVSGEKVVGIADYRKVARPSSGSYGLYLDDLYTAPALRGEVPVGIITAIVGAPYLIWLLTRRKERESYA